MCVVVRVLFGLLLGDGGRDDAAAAPPALPAPQLRTGEVLQPPLLQARAAGGLPRWTERGADAAGAPSALPPPQLRAGEALQRPLLQARAAGGLPHALQARAAAGALELLLREHVLVLQLVARQARPRAGHPRLRRPAVDTRRALQIPALVDQHVLGEALQGLVFAAFEAEHGGR